MIQKFWIVHALEIQQNSMETSDEADLKVTNKFLLRVSTPCKLMHGRRRNWRKMEPRYDGINDRE